MILADAAGTDVGQAQLVAERGVGNRSARLRLAGSRGRAAGQAGRKNGADGGGTYADVIRGIDWAVTNKDAYNIRVLNCSFSAPPQSSYWLDPLNQAVMRAWQAGIVVVASAGNTGPDPMTVGVPGNVQGTTEADRDGGKWFTLENLSIAPKIY